MIKVYKSKEVEVLFDELALTLIWRPLGILSTEEWKASFDAGLEFYARQSKKQNIFWLNDTKLMHSIGADNIKWLIDKCVSLALVQGVAWPYLLYVYPDNFYGKLSLDLFIKQAQMKHEKLQFVIFGNLDLAERWIQDNF